MKRKKLVYKLLLKKKFDDMNDREKWLFHWWGCNLEMGYEILFDARDHSFEVWSVKTNRKKMLKRKMGMVK